MRYQTGEFMPPTKQYTEGPDGWVEYRRLILSELERISNSVAKCELQANNIHTHLIQAIADAKQSLMEKMREVYQKHEDERDKVVLQLKTEFDKKVSELEQKTEKAFTEVTSLKAKATILGALAGFVVAVLGVIASIIWKK